jgi:hypothetical protein
MMTSDLHLVPNLRLLEQYRNFPPYALMLCRLINDAKGRFDITAAKQQCEKAKDQRLTSKSYQWTGC